MKSSHVLFVSALTMLSASLYGWGAKGHMMAGRVATQALPDDVPLFFRASAEQLAYLTPEPDRWRGNSWGGHIGPRQELTNLTAGNHNIRMEMLEGIPFPKTRNEYIVLMVEKGIVPRDEVNMHKVGMVFYAIIEEMQRLTVAFRLWREAQEAATLDTIALKQIQENAIFSAGVLGHWVTDSAEPLHVTVHSDDWDARYPNPKKYATKGIHGRFETQYVNRVIDDNDIRQRMTPAKVLTDWRAEAESHIRRSFSHFEEVYDMDMRGSFGSGKEVKEAHAFTAARLAEGASMLRDAWYSAWVASGEELNDMPVRYSGKTGRTALDLLREVKKVELLGAKLAAIGARRDDMDGRRWQMFADGKPVTESADRFQTTDGQTIEWRFAR